MSAFAPNTLALPSVLGGRYEARKRIGSGGMGEVYLARQLGLERDVAVKLLSHIPADPGQEERIKERFRREAVALSRLRHPNTLQVIDYGFTDDDRPFIVTELLEGAGLDELLARDRVLSVTRAFHIVTQVAMSLAEAHHHGIVHRDLKPSNVFLTQAFGKPDFVKLIDFGVARLDGADEVKQRPLTVEGTTLGTPDYMAPEQARGNRPLPATDVYALGCMLYELLTGAPPFTGDSALQVMIAHIRETPTPLRAARPDLGLPEAAEQLIGDCLAKEAALRPSDAGALLTRLEAVQTELDDQRRRAEHSAITGTNPRPKGVSRLESASEVSEAGFRKPVGLKRRGGRRNDDGDWEDSVVAPLPDLRSSQEMRRPMLAETGRAPTLEPARKAPEPPRSALEPQRSALEPQRSAAESQRSALEPQRSAAEPQRSAPEPQRGAVASPAAVPPTPLALPLPEVPDEVNATRLDVRPMFDNESKPLLPAADPLPETSGARRLIRGHQPRRVDIAGSAASSLTTRPHTALRPRAARWWLWPVAALVVSGLAFLAWRLF